MYISRNSTVVSLSQLEEDSAKGRLSPRAPVSQCAFKKLLKISVKNHTGMHYPRIRSFGELSELENLGIEDSEASSNDEEEGGGVGGVISLSSSQIIGADSKTLVDMTMLALWENCASNGLFRYDVTACSTKPLSGVYGFIAQLNEGRATKKRPTEFRIDEVLQPFDENKFHFGKAFMQEVLFHFDTKAANQTIIEEDAFTSRSPDLVMINVSPIEYGHILLIPKVLDQLPQCITPESMLLALQFTAAVDNPYFRLGYNSLGAYATINHLHFQGYYLMAPYPVERAITEPLRETYSLKSVIKVSRLVGYPVKGWVFEMMASLDDCLIPMASAIAKICLQLQKTNIPHNILISDCGARVFLWPQCYAKKQALGLVSDEVLATGINPACFEIAGHVIFKNKEDYQNFTQKEVWALLSQVSLESTEFNQLTEDCFASHQRS